MVKGIDLQKQLVTTSLEKESYPDELVEMQECPPLGQIFCTQNLIQKQREKNNKLLWSRLELCMQMTEDAYKKNRPAWFAVSMVGFVTTITVYAVKATYMEGADFKRKVVRVIR